MIMIEVVIGDTSYKVFGPSREQCLVILLNFLITKGLVGNMLTIDTLDSLAGSTEIGDGTIIASKM